MVDKVWNPFSMFRNHRLNPCKICGTPPNIWEFCDLKGNHSTSIWCSRCSPLPDSIEKNASSKPSTRVCDEDYDKAVQLWENLNP